MAIVIEKPAYYITVGNAYFHDASGGDVRGVQSIKSVGITRQKAEQTIYASGIAYDYTSQKTGQQLAVNALQLPQDLVRKYLGESVGTNKGFSFETSEDTLPEFAFGYSTTYSDGSREFKWYPRCKLISADDTKETSGTTPPDPSLPYTILALPMTNSLICTRYTQSEVDPAKTPLTEEEFFAQVIDAKTHEKVDSETAVAVP